MANSMILVDCKGSRCSFLGNCSLVAENGAAEACIDVSDDTVPCADKVAEEKKLRTIRISNYYAAPSFWRSNLSAIIIKSLCCISRRVAHYIAHRVLP